MIPNALYFSENSCASFFDVESAITKPLYDNFTLHCAGDGEGVCSEKCNESLNAYSTRFGCCLATVFLTSSHFHAFLF